MGRLFRLLLAAGVAALVSAVVPVSAQEWVSEASSVQTSELRGMVVDESGTPVPGALVSVMGPGVSVAQSGRDGLFTLRALQPALYRVRAFLPGQASSKTAIIELTAAVPSTCSLTLVGLRLPREVATGTAGTLPPPVLAAGMAGLEPAEQPDAALPTDTPPVSTQAAEPAAPDSHTPTAWRVRHLPRSVLRDSTERVAELVEDDGSADDEFLEPITASLSTNVAASGLLSGGVDFTGEVNLLTTRSFDGPRQLFADPIVPRGIAYLAIGAPIGRDADWSVKGAMTQGDVSSWVVAGSYASRGTGRHVFDAGMSYSTQRYEGGNPVALAAVTDGARNVGEMYGTSRVRISEDVDLTYGARYARYDYVEGPGLLSPQLGVTLALSKTARLRGSLSQRMTAPGAEEFLPPPMPGFWLPPERTFSALPGESAPFRPERVRTSEIGFEYDNGPVAFGVRRFLQDVDDQLVTLFGVRDPYASAFDLGHYYFASQGSTRIDGYAATVSCVVAERFRGSVNYSWSRARWEPSADMALVAVWAPSAARNDERFHDVTTSVETDIPETATRVFVLYKVNTAFARSEVDAVTPALDARFDVRVHQSLPFLAFTNVDWEVLVAVRNLFREVVSDASAYDELLVVRPPKRIVGGLLVRF
jgi:hypothetical protein